MRDATAFQELLAQVRELALPPDAHAGLVALFRQFDGSRMRVSADEIDRQERLAHAVRLIYRGSRRADVCIQLMARFGVSRRTASRDTAAALQKLAGTRADRERHG